jgi:hypothetical protein
MSIAEAGERSSLHLEYWIPAEKLAGVLDNLEKSSSTVDELYKNQNIVGLSAISRFGQ